MSKVWCPGNTRFTSSADAFRQLITEGKLHHGSGTFDYGDWAKAASDFKHAGTFQVF